MYIREMIRWFHEIFSSTMRNWAITAHALNHVIYFQRGVNRLTDQRILTVFSPGFRIQSKLLTDLRILQLQWFAVFFNFLAWSLDFACDKVRIVDLSDRQKCLFLFVFVCVCVAVVLLLFFCTDKTHRMSRSREIGIPGNSNALWPW